MARRETFKEGRIPLQTLRADIDYHYTTAVTKYGILGVKVWIYKGDIDDNKKRSSKRPSNKTQVRKNTRGRKPAKKTTDN